MLLLHNVIYHAIERAIEWMKEREYSRRCRCRFVCLFVVIFVLSISFLKEKETQKKKLFLHSTFIRANIAKRSSCMNINSFKSYYVSAYIYCWYYISEFKLRLIFRIYISLNYLCGIITVGKSFSKLFDTTLHGETHNFSFFLNVATRIHHRQHIHPGQMEPSKWNADECVCAQIEGGKRAKKFLQTKWKFWNWDGNFWMELEFLQPYKVAEEASYVCDGVCNTKKIGARGIHL